MGGGGGGGKKKKNFFFFGGGGGGGGGHDKYTILLIWRWYLSNANFAHETGPSSNVPHLMQKQTPIKPRKTKTSLPHAEHISQSWLFLYTGLNSQHKILCCLHFQIGICYKTIITTNIVIVIIIILLLLLLLFINH